MYNKTFIIIETIIYLVTKNNTHIKQRQKSVNTYKTGKTTVKFKGTNKCGHFLLPHSDLL